MREFNAKVGIVEIWVGVAMLTAIILLVFSSAVMRAVGRPIVWSVDLAQLLFVWISMFGADTALKKHAHVGVDLLVKKFTVKLQNTIAFCTYLLCIMFLSFITYYGVLLCITNYLRRYQTLQISYSFGTVAVPIGGVLMILTLIEHTVDLVGNWEKPVIEKSASA